ncbi:hypothetical protein TNCT_149821 [Trichonephila clavata]|uniref:Uncharacterized protein n=1 Tax=Trichonephila clavata TaxID=2740835 RepID=A0A8X6GXD4_TRICU|nr:hypothetical protein TNCT_149821 [Trichonephila clavata]
MLHSTLHGESLETLEFDRNNVGYNFETSPHDCSDHNERRKKKKIPQTDICTKVKTKTISKERKLSARDDHFIENSVIDIESEVESDDSSKKSVSSHATHQTSQTHHSKNWMTDDLKSYNQIDKHALQHYLENGNNPYCYSFHTLPFHPVVQQTISTQTEPKPAVAKKTASTQIAGKKSSSTQTIDKKSVGTQSPDKRNHSYFEDSGSSRATCVKKWRSCRLYRDSNFTTSGLREGRDCKFKCVSQGKKALEGGNWHSSEAPLRNTIFGVCLKHVENH